MQVLYVFSVNVEKCFFNIMNFVKIYFYLFDRLSDSWGGRGISNHQFIIQMVLVSSLAKSKTGAKSSIHGDMTQETESPILPQRVSIGNRAARTQTATVNEIPAQTVT